MRLEHLTTLTPNKSIERLDRILSRINLFQLAQEIQNLSLSTHTLLYSSDWVIAFFEHVNDKLFPIHNGDMWDDEDGAIFDYIFLQSPLSNWHEYDPDEFGGSYSFGIKAHSQMEDFEELPPYHEINQQGWEYVEARIKRHKSPFKYFYQLFSALDHTTGNIIWDWVDEAGELITWDKENIARLTADYAEVAEDTSHFEELTEWLARDRNYRKAVRSWNKIISTAHELFPRTIG